MRGRKRTVSPRNKLHINNKPEQQQQPKHVHLTSASHISTLIQTITSNFTTTWNKPWITQDKMIRNSRGISMCSLLLLESEDTGEMPFAIIILMMVLSYWTQIRNLCYGVAIEFPITITVNLFPNSTATTTRPELPSFLYKPFAFPSDKVSTSSINMISPFEDMSPLLVSAMILGWGVFISETLQRWRDPTEDDDMYGVSQIVFIISYIAFAIPFFFWCFTYRQQLELLVQRAVLVGGVLAFQSVLERSIFTLLTKRGFDLPIAFVVRGLLLAPMSFIWAYDTYSLYFIPLVAQICYGMFNNKLFWPLTILVQIALIFELHNYVLKLEQTSTPTQLIWHNITAMALLLCFEINHPESDYVEKILLSTFFFFLPSAYVLVMLGQYGGDDFVLFLLCTLVIWLIARIAGRDWFMEGATAALTMAMTCLGLFVSQSVCKNGTWPQELACIAADKWKVISASAVIAPLLAVLVHVYNFKMGPYRRVTAKYYPFRVRYAACPFNTSFDCSVCREDHTFRFGKWFICHEIELHCGHRFHYQCLLEWLDSSHVGKSCPLCRTRLCDD